MYIVVVLYGYVYVTVMLYEVHSIMRKLKRLEINSSRKTQILSGQIRLLPRSF